MSLAGRVAGVSSLSRDKDETPSHPAAVSLSIFATRDDTLGGSHLPRVDRVACATRPIQRRSSSDVVVDQVLEHLLAAAEVLGGLALGEDVGFEAGETGLARLDPTAELAVPAPAALLDELGQPAVGDDRVGDLQAAAKASMPPMWA